MPFQTPLPDNINAMGLARMEQRIGRLKRDLGESLCILGHHYQRDEVIQFADFVGDSLKLSQQAAAQTKARYIVFCGVHFMAESADILSSPSQYVILPNMRAGCTMADMADDAAVGEAIAELAAATDKRVVPVTYVNSSAAAKALTGKAGGACCTSSNVRNVFEWALRPESEGGAGGDRILAIPDQNLGLNTAVAMGYSPDDCVVYDPSLPSGGLGRQDIERATFILWKGYCYVHERFTVEHVRQARANYPAVRVIVHPECPFEVVQASDASGSTEQIIQAVERAKPGSSWAIGTESNLVNRLAKRNRDKYVRLLSDAPSLCRQMGFVDLPHLLWVLQNIADGRVVNQVSVAEATAAEARLALERMLAIRAQAGLTSGAGQASGD